MPASDLREELVALQGELAQAPAFAEEGDDAATPGEESNVRSEIERVLGELQAQLRDVTEDAEEIVAAHPIASIASAFLLGVVVGRLLSRAR